MVEAPLMKKVLDLLDELGVMGYTVVAALPVKDGSWHRDGLVGRAGAVVQIFCIIDESRVDAVVDPLFKMISRQIGIVTISDIQVSRRTCSGLAMSLVSPGSVFARSRWHRSRRLRRRSSGRSKPERAGERADLNPRHADLCGMCQREGSRFSVRTNRASPWRRR
jgi:hypothetical protein